MGMVFRFSSRSTIPFALSTITALAASLVLAACSSPAEDRQRAVAERGAAVMPFDLEATTHRFANLDDGLVQTVVADDPSDERQIGLVRSHLRSEAARFERGDFDDPAQIHGEAMAGLGRLRQHGGAVLVSYRDVPGGGQIRFSSLDRRLVDALHAWGAAQTSDHGDHADS